MTETSDFNVFNDFNHNLNKIFFDLFRLQDKDKYAPAILAVKYSLMGITLRNHQLNIGSLNLGTRLSHIISIRSGNGKKEFIRVIRTIGKALGYYVSEIMSLHEEQLIGKNVVTKEKDEDGEIIEVIETYKGCFWDDILIKDDALTFLNHHKFEVARSYFLTAWDICGENVVRKRLTEQKREHTLQYCPKFVSFMFVQDKKIEKDNINTGIVRKSLPMYIDAPEVDESKYLARVKAPNPDFEPFIKIAKNVKNADYVSWIFTEEADRFIAKASIGLYNEIVNKGSKAKEFALMLQWIIQNYLYIYSAILGAYYRINNPKENDWIEGYDVIVDVPLCQIAYNEFKIVLNAAVEHWLHFVEHTKSTFLGKWEKYIVEELKSDRAIGAENAILTTKFINRVSEKYSISATTLYNNLAELEQKEIVGRKIDGVLSVYYFPSIE